MKLSLRSRILVVIGTLIYGDPQEWGLDCTKEEFYAMPNERPLLNPRYLHPSQQQKWEVQHRNVVIDRVRQRVFKQMALAAFVTSFIVFGAGNLTISAVNKGKEVIASVKSNMKSSSNKKERIEELKKQADALTRKASEGSITKEEFDRQVEIIDAEYKQLTK